MIKKGFLTAATVLISAFWLIGFPAGAQEQANFATPPIILKAADVMSKDVLTDEDIKIADSIRNDGFMNSYELTTPYGTFHLQGTAQLHERVLEIQALKKLEELQNSEVFKKSAKEGLKGPIKTVGGLVTAPVETVSNVASGVGHWFKDVGRAVVSDDPDQPGAAKTALGQAAAKRAYAYELGVNPYSRFEPLQDRLNEVAWTAAGGGISIKVAFGQVSGGAGKALRVTGFSASMKQLVRDNSPAKLRTINQEKLRAMGVSESLANELLDNPIFDPQETTLLVGALEQTHGAEGREHFVAAASRATDRTIATFMRLNAEMIRQYNLSKGKIVEIVSAAGVPFSRTHDGKAVGFFAVDHLAWTRTLNDKQAAVGAALDRHPGLRGRELWIGGTVDPVARSALEKNGWVVVSGAGKKLTL